MQTLLVLLCLTTVKCKGCRRENSIDIDANSIKAYNAEGDALSNRRLGKMEDNRGV